MAWECFYWTRVENKRNEMLRKIPRGKYYGHSPPGGNPIKEISLKEDLISLQFLDSGITTT